MKKNSGTFPRLIKMLFRLNPTLLPIIIVLILVSAVISALPSIFQQNVVAVLEQAWSNGWNWETTRPQILHFVLILGALYLCGLTITTVSNQLGAVYTQRVLDQFRTKMFEHMESLPIRYFDTHQRGDIMSHYTNDVDAMRQMISQSFP
jgi:ATP-binding cassette subfamily B protein